MSRRFKRLISEAPRAGIDERAVETPAIEAPAIDEPAIEAPALAETVAGLAPRHDGAPIDIDGPGGDDEDESPWPDLVLIDGGRGQLTAAHETLTALGITDVPLVAIAKGPDRDAGQETFFMPGREPFKLKPRDPLLYFVQRLRDEAHRFAVGSHRTTAQGAISARPVCRKSPASARPASARCCVISGRSRRSSAPPLADLAKVPGISAETARKIYDFFHERAV